MKSGRRLRGLNPDVEEQAGDSRGGGRGAGRDEWSESVSASVSRRAAVRSALNASAGGLDFERDAGQTRPLQDGGPRAIPVRPYLVLVRRRLHHEDELRRPGRAIPLLQRGRSQQRDAWADAANLAVPFKGGVQVGTLEARVDRRDGATLCPTEHRFVEREMHPHGGKCLPSGTAARTSIAILVSSATGPAAASSSLAASATLSSPGRHEKSRCPPRIGSPGSSNGAGKYRL